MMDPDYGPNDEHKGSAGPALFGIVLLFMVACVAYYEAPKNNSNPPAVKSNTIQVSK